MSRVTGTSRQQCGLIQRQFLPAILKGQNSWPERRHCQQSVPQAINQKKKPPTWNSTRLWQRTELTDFKKLNKGCSTKNKNSPLPTPWLNNFTVMLTQNLNSHQGRSSAKTIILVPKTQSPRCPKPPGFLSDNQVPTAAMDADFKGWDTRLSDIFFSQTTHLAFYLPRHRQFKLDHTHRMHTPHHWGSLRGPKQHHRCSYGRESDDVKLTELLQITHAYDQNHFAPEALQHTPFPPTVPAKVFCTELHKSYARQASSLLHTASPFLLLQVYLSEPISSSCPSRLDPWHQIFTPQKYPVKSKSQSKYIAKFKLNRYPHSSS